MLDQNQYDPEDKGQSGLSKNPGKAQPYTYNALWPSMYDNSNDVDDGKHNHQHVKCVVLHHVNRHVYRQSYRG